MKGIRERLEIRDLADRRYRAHAGEVFQLLNLADAYGEDAVLDWLRNGVPTPRLDISPLADLLAPGVTERQFRSLPVSAT